MGVSPRLQLPWPELTVLADGPDAFQDLAMAIDNAAIYGQGTFANRPISTAGQPGIQGRLYAATDLNPVIVYLDTGTAWVAVGAVLPGSIGTTQLADRSVTTIKIALGAVTADELADAAVTGSKIADLTITAGKLAAALKPSQGAGAAAEALRALGTAPGNAAAGIHAAQHAPGGADPLPVSIPTVPLGAILDYAYASGSIPAWALLPVGQEVSRTTYAELHALAAAAGYPHGNGNTTTTFNLPDLRGRVVVGKDDMGGTAASRITVAISGISGGLLGAVGGAEGITLTVAQIPAHNHGGVTGAPSGAVADAPGGSAISTGVGGYKADGSTGSHTHTIPNQGGGGSHANIQPMMVVNKIMRVL